MFLIEHKPVPHTDVRGLWLYGKPGTVFIILIIIRENLERHLMTIPTLILKIKTLGSVGIKVYIIYLLLKVRKL